MVQVQHTSIGVLLCVSIDACCPRIIVPNVFVLGTTEQCLWYLTATIGFMHDRNCLTERLLLVCIINQNFALQSYKTIYITL